MHAHAGHGDFESNVAYEAQGQWFMSPKSFCHCGLGLQVISRELCRCVWKVLWREERRYATLYLEKLRFFPWSRDIVHEFFRINRGTGCIAAWSIFLMKAVIDVFSFFCRMMDGWVKKPTKSLFQFFFFFFSLWVSITFLGICYILTLVKESRKAQLLHSFVCLMMDVIILCQVHCSSQSI
jgi:hypothetical protein